MTTQNNSPRLSQKHETVGRTEQTHQFAGASDATRLYASRRTLRRNRLSLRSSGSYCVLDPVYAITLRQ